MGASTGGQKTPLEFENDDVIGCSSVKYPKFVTRAFGARHGYTYIQVLTDDAKLHL